MGLTIRAANRARVFRIIAAVVAVVVVSIAAFTSFGPLPASGEGAVASFAPSISTPLSPTPFQTALPPPISRPEDARGITQTTAPYVSPTSFSPPPAPPSLWLSAAASFNVPCELHGDRIFVNVVVDGRPETFLLDSAAPFSSIDPSAARSHDAPIVLHTLQIGELRFNALKASVSRIAQATMAYLGKPADGILGQELFSRYPVKIDYHPCAMTIFRDSQAVAAGSTAPNASAFPIHMRNGRPEIEVRFDGAVAATLLVATASDAQADVTREFVATNRLSFASSIPELRRWLPSGELAGETGRTTSIALGPFVVDRPLVGVIEAGDRSATGYIGNGMLENFSVLFDEPAGRLTLDPLSGAKSAPYDRSGAWLVVRGGAITVKTVLFGSPAGKTPLYPGDRIVLINGHSLGDLDDARALFAGAPGTALTVTYERAGRQHSGVIVLKTLL